MIIVRIMGGLGNQMFQYALFKDLQYKGKNAKIDLSWYEKLREHNGYELKSVFNIDGNIATKTESSLLGEIEYDLANRLFRKLVKHKSTFYSQDVNTAILFDENVFQLDNKYLSGYWQSEKYFYEIKNEIRSIYTFPEINDEENLKYLDEILKHNSVSIHIRRGDYLKSKYLKGVCDLSYYKSAIDYISRHLKKPIYFVFSDDIEWCKTNFTLSNAFYLGHNISKNSYIDMHLMSLCKHNIIANSSFSWWGAWLNKNESKIVYAPSRWFNNKDIDTCDIIPHEWVRTLMQ